METIIIIKKNKPAFKALILIAKELEKNDHTSISISERTHKKGKIELITPIAKNNEPFQFFNHLADFPASDELRKLAWPQI
jgi:hypothetical protein